MGESVLLEENRQPGCFDNTLYKGLHVDSKRQTEEGRESLKTMQKKLARRGLQWQTQWGIMVHLPKL